jgi:hypothetical protein
MQNTQTRAAGPVNNTHLHAPDTGMFSTRLSYFAVSTHEQHKAHV